MPSERVLLARELVLGLALVILGLLCGFVAELRGMAFGGITLLITGRLVSLAKDQGAQQAGTFAAEHMFRKLSRAPDDAPPEARPLLEEARRVPRRSHTGFTDSPPGYGELGELPELEGVAKPFPPEAKTNPQGIKKPEGP